MTAAVSAAAASSDADADEDESLARETHDRRLQVERRAGDALEGFEIPHAGRR